MRRKKELEIEILHGKISGWESDEPLSSLGSLIKLSPVTVGVEKSDQYLLLFTQNLIFLAASPRMSGFIFKVGKLTIPFFSNIIII